ncbi:hypothetical protein [Streptomyces nigrescens]
MGDEDEICDSMSRLWLAAYQYKAFNLEPSINRVLDGEESSAPGPAATTSPRAIPFYDRPFTAIPYDDVREALAMSPARRQVLILDCCFSGRAVQESMGTVAEFAATTGTYVLSSTSSTRAAIASLGKLYPDFTGMLIDILERGVKGAPELLDIRTIYHTLRERLAGQGAPQPKMTSRGGVPLALGLSHAADAV